MVLTVTDDIEYTRVDGVLKVPTSTIVKEYHITS